MSVLREIDELLRGNRTDVNLLAKGTEHLRLGPYVGASVVHWGIGRAYYS